MTSCGSLPTGMRVITCNETRSTIASVWSVFASASNDPCEDWALHSVSTKAFTAISLKRCDFKFFIARGVYFTKMPSCRQVLFDDANLIHRKTKYCLQLIYCARACPHALMGAVFFFECYCVKTAGILFNFSCDAPFSVRFALQQLPSFPRPGVT